MQKSHCIIVGAGSFYPDTFEKISSDFIIAADGGYDHLKKISVVPDVLLGDFDSIYKTPDTEQITLPFSVLTLPEEKDDTDTLAAIRYAQKQGYETFHLFGAVGGRIGHTIANIQTLIYLHQAGQRGFIYDDHQILTILENETIDFPVLTNEFLTSHSLTNEFSVFAIDQCASGISLKNFKYELCNASLSNNFPIGVSNEFTKKPCSISTGKGMVLCVFPSLPRNMLSEIFDC